MMPQLVSQVQGLLQVCPLQNYTADSGIRPAQEAWSETPPQCMLPVSCNSLAAEQAVSVKHMTGHSQCPNTLLCAVVVAHYPE